MSFGLTNAPRMFMMLMTNVLWPFMGKFEVYFIDVVLVYSKNILEHATHLKLVCQALYDTKLYIDQEKNFLCLAKIEYLGHTIFYQ